MIAASIVTYKTSTDELADCLRCLAACDTIARVDVVDNASQQSLKDFPALNFPDVNYIPNVNNGYG
ncbi:MAG: glycosyltransferase family 2 protein, partial [Muribaculaceae bacterium]|nr:glycosyltransferase family 2 protein [Muribaculaceae bacterium]